MSAATQQAHPVVRVINSVQFKAALWALSIAAMLATFGVALSQFRSSDQIPQVKLIDMAMRKKIRNFASVVRTGMFIKNFEVFDINNDRFILGAVVWFEFNTDEVMPETLEKFSFMNGKVLSRSPGDIRVNGTKMFVRYDVRVEVKSQLTYNRFPFDDHRVALAMTNDFVTPSEVYFTVDNSSFGISDDVFTNNWQVHETGTAWGYADLDLDDHDSSKSVQRPVVVYNINFSKAGIRGIVIIFIPLLAGLFLALFTFLLGIDNTVTRFRLSMGALTSILSYRFIIDRMMPPVGYFTTTDSIYTMILLSSLLTFVFQIGINRYVEGGSGLSKEAAPTLELINSVLFIMIMIGVPGMMAYFILS